MESNFRSTVLQRPPDKDDDRERRHARDILNPASSIVAAPGAPQAPPPRHAGFSLRSPTQSEFSYSTPSGANNHHQSPSRPVLSSFMSPSVGSSQALPPHHSSSNTSSNHHHAAPPSPLRGSPAYYPPQPKEVHREKQGSFYDPLTDTTTNERRVSETGSWHGASTPKVSCVPTVAATRCTLSPSFIYLRKTCHHPIYLFFPPKSYGGPLNFLSRFQTQFPEMSILLSSLVAFFPLSMFELELVLTWSLLCSSFSLDWAKTPPWPSLFD